MTSDYIVELRIRNGYMRKQMLANGYYSVAELSRASGVRPSRVGDFMNLKNWRWTSIKFRPSRTLRQRCCLLQRTPKIFWQMPSIHWGNAKPKPYGSISLKACPRRRSRLGCPTAMDATVQNVWKARA